MVRKRFLRKVASRLWRYPTGQKFRSIPLRFREKHVFVFNAEIQDGHQKWRENDFCEKSPVDSGDNLPIKNFVEISLSRSVFEISMFLRLTQKFKMAAKSAGKIIFASRLCKYSVGQKFRRNCSISLRFRDKCVFAFSALRKIMTFS